MRQGDPLGGDITLEVIRVPEIECDDAKSYLILCAIRPGIGDHHQIRLVGLGDAKPSSVLRAVKSIIEAGSIVRTTEWPGFNKLRGAGYDHRLELRISKVGATMTDEGEDIQKQLCSVLLGVFSGSVRSLNAYLEEFAFRFSQHVSTKNDDGFWKVLKLAALPFKGK